jgi:DUF4097 and DUF4098 domain-containing protein YvlB
MKAFRNHTTVVLLVLFLSTAVFLSTAQAGDDWVAKGRFERTLQVSGAVGLKVETTSGNISVRRGSGNSVHIIGEIRARGTNAEEKVKALEAEPPIQQTGNTIRIGKIEEEALRRKVSISYEIHVPAHTRLDAGSGSGDVIAEAILGPVSAATGSGNVSVNDIEREVNATTGSGDVKIDGASAGVKATTGSGNIQGTNLKGGAVLQTGSGNIEVEQSALGDVRVGTGSGNVHVTGVKGRLTAETGSGDVLLEGAPQGSWRLSAGSGNLRVKLPTGTGYELDAETSSGEIRVDAPITLTGAISRRRVRGTVGGGGAFITAETGSGDIVVESR